MLRSKYRYTMPLALPLNVGINVLLTRTWWPGQLSNKDTGNLAQCSVVYRFPAAIITIEKNVIILLAIMIVKSNMVQATIYDY
jgi:hypothetical protein